MNVLDLFSGIGGFSLGLERAGMRTVAFCEINRYCRRILRQHWPVVPVYSDVRALTAARLSADGIIPNVICGGFPCQDVSLAGSGAGLEGHRSGLWFEFARLIEEVGPEWVIIENVSALRGRGLGDVLRTLASLGYDAEWHCIPASALGAPHQRDRVWIVANPASAQSSDRDGEPGRLPEAPRRMESAGLGQIMADTVCQGSPRANDRDSAGSPPSGVISRRGIDRMCAEIGANQWAAEPNVGRVADGVPDRVDRIGSLGNAVVPIIPELIGRAIMSVQNQT